MISDGRSELQSVVCLNPIANNTCTIYTSFCRITVSNTPRSIQVIIMMDVCGNFDTGIFTIGILIFHITCDR